MEPVPVAQLLLLATHMRKQAQRSRVWLKLLGSVSGGATPEHAPRLQALWGPCIPEPGAARPSGALASGPGGGGRGAVCTAPGLPAGLSDLPRTRRQSLEPRFLPLSLTSAQFLLCEGTVTRLAQPII